MLNNETAIEQARQRLITLMRNSGDVTSIGASAKASPSPKQRAAAPTLSVGSRAQIDTVLGRDSKRSAAGGTGHEGSSGGTAASASSRRTDARGIASAGAARTSPTPASNLTAAERGRNRGNRQSRSETRGELYRDVESFLQEDLAGGVRSRAAVVDLATRSNAFTANGSSGYLSSSRRDNSTPGSGDDDGDDDLARAIAMSLAER